MDLHFDYHDVIVVQLTGSKAWRTWHPLERSRLPQKRGAGIPRPQWDELSDPLIEAVLKPGDALVILAVIPMLRPPTMTNLRT